MGREKAYDVDSIVKEVSEQNVRDLVDNWDEVAEKFKKDAEHYGLGSSAKKLGKLDESRLMWEGEPVPVRNPELVDVLLKVQSAEMKMASSSGKDGKAPTKGSQGGKKAVAAYDSVLAALSDAEEVARKLSESESQKVSMKPVSSCWLFALRLRVHFAIPCSLSGAALPTLFSFPCRHVLYF